MVIDYCYLFFMWLMFRGKCYFYVKYNVYDTKFRLEYVKAGGSSKYRKLKIGFGKISNYIIFVI